MSSKTAKKHQDLRELVLPYALSSSRGRCFKLSHIPRACSGYPASSLDLMAETARWEKSNRKLLDGAFTIDNTLVDGIIF